MPSITFSLFVDILNLIPYIYSYFATNLTPLFFHYQIPSASQSVLLLLLQFCQSSDFAWIPLLLQVYSSVFMCDNPVYSGKLFHACYHLFSFSYTYFIFISLLGTRISSTSVNFKLASGELYWASEVCQKMSWAHFQKGRKSTLTPAIISFAWGRQENVFSRVLRVWVCRCPIKRGLDFCSLFCRRKRKSHFSVVQPNIWGRMKQWNRNICSTGPDKRKIV